MNDICDDCRNQADCENKDTSYICPALKELRNIYKENYRRLKKERLMSLKQKLSCGDSEVDSESKKICEKLIKEKSDLNFIKQFDIKIGCVKSYKPKMANNKPVFATCTKTNDMYSAYIPYDFIITVYDFNVMDLSEQQRKILLYHELLHIGIGPKGLKVEPHDVEDFDTIIAQYGLHWENPQEDE